MLSVLIFESFSLIKFFKVYKALEASRKVGGANTIYLRGGIHYLDSPIELSSRDSGLILSSYPNEVAQLNGGMFIFFNIFIYFLFPVLSYRF